MSDTQQRGNLDNQVNDSKGPPNGSDPIIWEVIIWSIGVIAFLVPYVVVAINMNNWVEVFGNASTFLTYVGFLITPCGSAFLKIKSSKRFYFSLPMIALSFAFVCIFCLYQGDEPTKNLAITSVVLGSASIVLTIATYIFINTRKIKLENKNG